MVKFLGKYITNKTQQKDFRSWFHCWWKINRNCSFLMKQVTIDSNLVFFVDMKWQSTFRFSCHYIFVVYGFYSFFCCQSPICHLNYFRPINYIEAVPETNILLQLIVWSKKLFFSCQHFLFSLAKNTVQELGVLNYCKIHSLVKINTYFYMGRD